MFIGHLWAGWTDEETEGDFISILNSSVRLDNSEVANQWKSRQPNGFSSENCVILNQESKFEDAACSNTAKGLCEIDITKQFILRGISSPFTSEKYTLLKGLDDGFLGMDTCNLKKDDTLGQYTINNLRDNTTYAVLAEGNSYFGLRKWTYFEGGKSKSIDLHFSACDDSFNCQDGTW